MLQTAFRFISYDISKMLGILAGIVISVVLIGQQLGIFNSMIDNMRGLAKHNPNYIWVVNQKSMSAMQMLNIDVRVGRELQSVPGVRAVYPVVLAGGSAKTTKGTKTSIQLIGIQAPDFKGGASAYTPETNLSELINDGAVIVDQLDMPTMDSLSVGDYFTINDQRVYVSGVSRGMTGFGSSYMITTLERARKLSNMDANYVNAFLVDVDTAVTTRPALIQRIGQELGQVKAMPGSEFGNETLRYMLETSNIAVSFGMMVLFAIISGFAIVGLTMFSSVKDRIRDYGTIKAIGGSNGLIRRLILTQAGLYAVLGYGVAYGFLMLMKLAMAGGRMAVSYPPWLIALLVVVTLVISLISSLIAMRKITKLEPVQIFRM
ncbi:ABC transporter permease [Spirosoma montaniterrae]|uniref:ABC transporter permease n=1 Tax=Spirosoma montaniterrae TaxID=1178516 RepID=A0A1P9X275_9BACT|nr:FtsX-like permease family protein [Spirosoma montaniterrae]AQG81734.1 hypothetical protein AWR27_21975 [Spirosoma montaniterrae]